MKLTKITPISPKKIPYVSVYKNGNMVLSLSLAEEMNISKGDRVVIAIDEKKQCYIGKAKQNDIDGWSVCYHNKTFTLSTASAANEIGLQRQTKYKTTKVDTPDGVMYLLTAQKK